jgi:CBS-domain-containing membrane protein
MENKDEECVITDEDLRAALKEIETYIDVTLDDLKRIYSLALNNAKERKRLSGK